MTEEVSSQKEKYGKECYIFYLVFMVFFGALPVSFYPDREV